VVDDETRLARLTAALLEDQGFSVATAPTAAQATVTCDEQEVDVVLLDVHLQDATAGELLARLRERSFRGRVILTSGYAEEDVEPALLRHPLVRGYLGKPYAVEQLVTALRGAAA
jgi:CheY-like chemotaxis protein